MHGLRDTAERTAAVEICARRNLKIITIYIMVCTTQCHYLTHYLHSSLGLCRNRRSTDRWWRTEGWAMNQKHRWERWRGCVLYVSAHLENCNNVSACRSERGKKKKKRRSTVIQIRLVSNKGSSIITFKATDTMKLIRRWPLHISQQLNYRQFI